jgi:hypothetical protein
MLRLIILSGFVFLISICSAGEIPPPPGAREAGVDVSDSHQRRKSLSLTSNPKLFSAAAWREF